jgi:hypothetical protein
LNTQNLIIRADTPDRKTLQTRRGFYDKSDESLDGLDTTQKMMIILGESPRRRKVEENAERHFSPILANVTLI